MKEVQEKLTRSLAEHWADYPEAREAINSLVTDLGTALLLLDEETREFEAFQEAVRARPVNTRILDATGVPAMIDRARTAMSDIGSNDAEHDCLEELTEHVARLYGLDGKE
jgi:hypothetical protein